MLVACTPTVLATCSTGRPSSTRRAASAICSLEKLGNWPVYHDFAATACQQVPFSSNARSWSPSHPKSDKDEVTCSAERFNLI